MKELDLPFPICATCKKRVDWMEAHPSHLHDGYRVIVHCHGEKEEMILDNIILAVADNIVAGEAFSRKRITDDQKA